MALEVRRHERVGGQLKRLPGEAHLDNAALKKLSTSCSEPNS